MKTIIENTNRHNGRVMAGAIIFLLGCALFVDQLDIFFIPDWIFTWPMILIAVGLYIGAKNNFQNLTWITLVFIGGAFLLDDALPALNLDDFIWPGGIIALGIYLIMRNTRHHIPVE